MKLFGKNLSVEVAVVAEIGVNHEGDPDAAIRLLHLAADAGADAVKFQTYSPERFASASDPERLARVTRFALDEATHRRLAHEAEVRNISFFSSAITEDVVPLLAELGEAIKIASGDINFEPVVRAAARTGRVVIVSTGLATMAEVDQAVGWLVEEIGEEAVSERVVLMQCVSAYPTPVNEANVRSIPFFIDRYGLPVGYSNHVVEPEACLAAVALGACVVEVHFTDRKTGRSFRDHVLSAEPDELASLARRLNLVKQSLGTFEKQRQRSEMDNLISIRKGVVAARDLEEGTQLTWKDLMYARPSTEFSAHEAPELIGKRMRRGRTRGELIHRTDLSPD